MRHEACDSEREDRCYSAALLRAYEVVFPRISVGVQTVDEPSGWIPEDAIASVAGLASSPVIDHCLHRGLEASRRTCIPHLILDCTRKGSYETLPSEQTEAILTGEKLSSKEKAVLGLVRDVRKRVLFTLAYAANRCYSAGFSRAVVVMFFEVHGGVGHANMLLLERGSPTSLSVTVYEPNGVEAATDYDTKRRFFSHLSESLGPLVGCEVSLRFVGLALQTYLGRRLVRRTRSSVSVVERGYPVCQAAVLWLFSLYVEANTTIDLADFEARLMEEDRGRLKLRLLDWILALKNWVETAYAERMAAKLSSVFRATNVARVTLRYGAVEVVWPSEDEGGF
jgi:hypothetical protein